MSRTKIVATYGPACEKDGVFRDMVRKGLDVVRLNVSHLAPDQLGETVERLRGIAKKTGMPLAVLADMPGPKIRLTECAPPQFKLHEGDRIEVAPGKGLSTPARLHIPYPHLLDDLKKGSEMAVNDGLVLLKVVAVDRRAGALKCRCEQGGAVASRKGVCFLQTALRISGLTPRDREGLRAAAAANVDFVALSFVRSADDLHTARRLLKRAGNPDIPLISKIEQHEAVNNIDEIIAASDGVMVARGDMGIEFPLEQVPLLQKDIIERCNRARKYVITATQMLESMIEHSRPTRAEVTDVANAILDGTDAVMLSAETAMGHNPALVVETMTNIGVTAEGSIDHLERLRDFHPEWRHNSQGAPNLDDALAYAACQLVVDARLDAIVCFTFHGSTAARIARYRPKCPVFVLTPFEKQARRMALLWGVEVFIFPDAAPDKNGRTQTPGRLIAPALEQLMKAGRLKTRDHVALLAGVPLETPGGTNWLRVVEV